MASAMGFRIASVVFLRYLSQRCLRWHFSRVRRAYSCMVRENELAHVTLGPWGLRT